MRDYLTKEEIAGRDEEIIFDPYLKEILKTRKEQAEISDIIETIQEKQYEIITKPERDSFVLQGCAGSGKTMIMLHRLSFLLYNNEDLKPRDVLVITPSDSFNAFIDELSQVLELEKSKRRRSTDIFCRSLPMKALLWTARQSWRAVLRRNMHATSIRRNFTKTPSAGCKRSTTGFRECF